MARSARDAAAILAVISGADPLDASACVEPVPDYLTTLHAGVSDLVIGIDWRFATDEMPAEVIAAMRNASEVFRELGARVCEVALPSMEVVGTQIIAALLAEIAVAHTEYYPQLKDRYGPRLRALLEVARTVDAQSVVRGYQARDRLTGALHSTFTEVDLLLLPAMGCSLPTWDDIDAYDGDVGAMSRTTMRFTMPFNVTGVPTLSLPGGFDDRGLPVGLQLIGWKRAEDKLLRAGHAFQMATDYHTRHPPLD
jgi:amidase